MTKVQFPSLLQWFTWSLFTPDDTQTLGLTTIKDSQGSIGMHQYVVFAWFMIWKLYYKGLASPKVFPTREVI